ncbi:hypothetical protein AB835_04375 [Candidatus Endobugula sertula]|uniref:DUF2796 domain-containing protein n=1 Tax=Candidatus Endobugula sertula TaxID=62101 RepID=A0A1D2QRU5_9GAMM|nr:hypothetical protein AB835_04375 [Candidatus Endobugula sertula]
MALIGITQSTYAQTRVASLGAHVHGLSELTIVIEGETLEIQFTSPAINLVGFEHKANTKEDVAAIKIAESQLRRDETLFLFPEGRCNHVKTSIDLASLINSDDEHAHQKKSSTYEDHVQEGSHSDITAWYQYRCKDSASLSSIRVAFFKLFSGIHKIQAMWVNQTRQGAITLTPDNSILQFR